MPVTKGKLEKPTREEVEALKADWKNDSCWDLETTDGFEAYHDELKAYRLKVEAERKARYNAKLIEQSKSFGCSVPLAEYIAALEYRLERMQEKIDRFDQRVYIIERNQ